MMSAARLRSPSLSASCRDTELGIGLIGVVGLGLIVSCRVLVSCPEDDEEIEEK
jgi:hypothetical protein